MTHIEQRLQERNISIDMDKLVHIAKCAGSDAAVMLGRVPYQNDDNQAYGNRELSNGELVVLIIRNGVPHTIMFRRENQPFTCEALRVKRVYSI